MSPRTIHLAIGADDSGVWAIGDTPEQARALALDRRAALRDDSRRLVFSDFPPPATDQEWADGLLYATMTGSTEALRAVVLSDLKDAIPWCPADLWDTPTNKEP